MRLIEGFSSMFMAFDYIEGVFDNLTKNLSARCDFCATLFD